MTLRRPAALCAALFVALVYLESGRAQQPIPPATPTPAVVDIQGGQMRVVTVATGLVHPWSIAFLPDGRSMLVAEQNGRLRIIRDGVLDPQPVWTAPAIAAQAAAAAAAQGGNAAAGGAQAGGRGRGQGGGGGDNLKWVTLHPRFAQNSLVYVSYGKSGERGSTLAIARGRFDGKTLTDVKEIFVADAWERGGNLAGKILFGPGDMLYATVGDRDAICCNAQQLRPDGTDDNTMRMKAQTLDNHIGKTLRLKDDGTVPPDNPFVGRAGAKPEIFTYGHRNGYGLAFNSETGELWQAEIGPMGGDEVNILLPGHNYGWPLVSMGRNYTGNLVSDRPFYRDGMDNARMFWVPSISPSSLLFYTGDKFTPWKNNMFVGALNGQALMRIAFKQPSQAERREPLLRTLNIRIRDVQQSPDGYLYVATELSSGGPNADGTILRLEPVAGATGGGGGGRGGGGRGRGQGQN